MKRIISISLGGRNFQIEEDACNYLHNVLITQRNVSEVERAVASEFDRLMIAGKTFISYPDVVDVLYRLGISGSNFHSAPRRLYRSRTDKIIAGVCAGIGDYFNIDPVLVRILVVVGAIAGTIGLWLYIVLWIVVPPSPRLS